MNEGGAAGHPGAPSSARAALLETVLVVAVVHFTYKALKLVEPSGSNLTPGLTMALTALLLVRVHRDRAIDFGLGTGRGGVTWCVAGLVALIAIGAAGLERHTWEQVLGAIAFRVLVVGAGEELFFRGYVQSRLDAALGTPWRVLGANLGWGVVFTAALFGLVHAANPTLWYQGRFDFDARWGAATFASGLLLFGWLRARTASVWPAVVVHGVTGAASALLRSG